MANSVRRNDDEYVRAGGPYADLIRELVESGEFNNAAEVVLEGLALLQQQELMRKAARDKLRADIQVGIDQADRGECVPAEQVFAELEAKLKAKAEQRDKT